MSGGWTGLPRVSAEDLARFDAACPAAEDEVVARCLAEDAPGDALAADGAHRIRVGMRFVSRMVRASMGFAAGAILDDQLEWARVRLPVDGVAPGMVLRNLVRYREALARRLPDETSAAIAPWIDALVRRQRAIAEGADDAR